MHLSLVAGLALSLLLVAATQTNSFPTEDDVVEAMTITSAYRLSFEPYEDTFQQFISEYEREYKSPAEKNYRRAVFMANLKEMEEHNQLYEQGIKGFFMDINQFADMTLAEYHERNRLGPFGLVGHWHPPNKNQSKVTECMKFVGDRNAPVPDSVDWRKKGVVTPVQDQAHCGSCYVFSSVGATESHFAIQFGKLYQLSVQQVLDCCYVHNCVGCFGGRKDSVFTYITEFGGIELSKEYPYSGRDHELCDSDKKNVKVNVVGCTDLPQLDEEAMKVAVATVGPIAVAFDAEAKDFKPYKGGIYHSTICDPNHLDHSVLIVGYGTENGQDYWLVKNSWGTSFGIEGYFKIARNSKLNCGIATIPSYPLTAKPTF